MKLDHCLTPHTTLNSKLINDLNIRLKTIKSQKKTQAENLRHCTQQYFSDISPKAKETKEKINKWDYIKLKSFCAIKENIDKIKIQPMEWKNRFTDTCDKGLISKIYKELIKLNTKTRKKNKKTTQLKMGKGLE